MNNDIYIDEIQILNTHFQNFITKRGKESEGNKVFDIYTIVSK